MKPLLRLAPYLDALSGRERLALLAVLTVILVLGGDQFVLEPLWTRVSATEHQIQAVQAEIGTSSRTIQALEAANPERPDSPLGRESAQARATLAALDGQLAARGQRFLTPRQLGEWLRDLLQNGRGGPLRTIGIESLPAETIYPPMGEGPGLYRKGVVLRFSGTFPAILAYFETLARENPVVWGPLTYRVVRYPEAEVTARVYTVMVGDGRMPAATAAGLSASPNIAAAINARLDGPFSAANARDNDAVAQAKSIVEGP